MSDMGLILINQSDLLKVKPHTSRLACLPVLLCLRVTMPTDLVCDGKRGVKPVVLDDSAAPLRRTDSAHISHAQSVARVVSAQILQRHRQIK